MSKPEHTEITIVVRDGMVTDTIANTPDITISIIDLDGCDMDELEEKEDMLSTLQEEVNEGKAWYV